MVDRLVHKKCLLCNNEFIVKGKPKPLTLMLDAPVCESCKSISDFEDVGTTKLNEQQTRQLKEEDDKDKADRDAKITRQKKSSEEGDSRYSDWY